jgi:hypothetical protein
MLKVTIRWRTMFSSVGQRGAFGLPSVNRRIAVILIGALAERKPEYFVPVTCTPQGAHLPKSPGVSRASKPVAFDDR